LLDEVRGFARRKPGTFLLVAAAAGVVAGRLTRALAAGGTDTQSNSRSTYASANGLGTPGQAGGDYLVPPPSTPMSTPSVGETTPLSTPSVGETTSPLSTPPVGETTSPPPMPTPVAPDPDPGAPVTPRFGPGQGQ
jgi:hypothetical protein